ncbi:hypothetical protein IFT43_05760 [Oxalobacteraceae sp. CFBP 13708]|nr:hypothetical protein [Oxalobacteraceae sp. CFBP 8761]MBD8722869.1 hypothetical protein [Oxalobacteraceae sp. CFBP 13708]
MLTSSSREKLALAVESTWMVVKRLFVVPEASMAGPMLDAAVKPKLSEAGLPLLRYIVEQCARHAVQASAVIQEQSYSKDGGALVDAVVV